jgi:hypothetical protein
MSECDGSVSVAGEVREIKADGFVVFRNMREGEYVMTIWAANGETGTKKCVISRHVGTKG